LVVPAQYFPFPKPIALTFDDGPRPETTKRILAVLERYHVHATFFVVGHVACHYPEVLKTLDAEGHELANHSWTHSDIRGWSPRRARWELDSTRLLIEGITGKKTFYFRTPGSTEGFIRKHFRVPKPYHLVLWDVHSLDQEGISAQQIVDRVEAQVKAGDVLLFHNGIGATVEALEFLIPDLKAKGYSFVTLSTLERGKRIRS
jgi:peptidoglycan/xylan/chitin deacetylase (PgdA/CDA1 family)